ncbi:MAG: ribonuclease P protein subunit [Candidatus Diapherotrites archaeon]|nr:ribonuclease P protein subunit [Candidatus Diapherotrites archaeon]
MKTKIEMIKTKNYEINKENVLFHELIGLNAEIKKAYDKNKIGLKGKIIFETKNSIILETKNGEKIIGKKEAFIEIDLKDEKKEIELSKILMRPEDRTKNWRKIDD